MGRNAALDRNNDTAYVNAEDGASVVNQAFTDGATEVKVYNNATWTQTVEVPDGATLDLGNSVISIPDDATTFNSYTFDGVDTRTIITTKNRDTAAQNTNVTIRGGVINSNLTDVIENTDQNFFGVWLFNAKDSSVEEMEVNDIVPATGGNPTNPGNRRFNGICLTECDSATVRESTVTNCGYSGIEGRGRNANCVVESCNTRGHGDAAHGIHFAWLTGSTSGASWTKAVVRDCDVSDADIVLHNNGTYGQAEAPKILGCYAGGGESGIYENFKNAVVADSRFDRVVFKPDDDQTNDTASGIVFSNNTIEKTGGDRAFALIAENSGHVVENVKITDSTIKGASFHSIAIEGPGTVRDVTIRGCSDGPFDGNSPDDFLIVQETATLEGLSITECVLTECSNEIVEVENVLTGARIVGNDVTAANPTNGALHEDTTETPSVSDTTWHNNSGLYEPMSTAPTGPSAGREYLDDGTNRADGVPGMRVYTGTTWRDIAGVHSDGGDSLPAQDLSTITPADGRRYRHNGANSISADGGTTSAEGYYVYSATDTEFKTVVAF